MTDKNFRWARDRYDRPINEWEPDDHEAENLNTEAYLALGQCRHDIVTPLATLLRSKHALDDVLRHALADALEGKDRLGIPIQVKITGQNSGPLGGKAEASEKFRRDMQIARFIDKSRSTGISLSNSIENAACHFIKSVDLCELAYKKYRKFKSWRSNNLDICRDLLEIGDAIESDSFYESLYFEWEIWSKKRKPVRVP